MKACYRCGAGKRRYKTSSYCEECIRRYQKERYRRLHPKKLRIKRVVRGGATSRLYSPIVLQNRGRIDLRQQRVFCSGPCVHCGEQFTQRVVRDDVSPKYCSKQCLKASYKRRSGRKSKFRGETRDMIPVLLADPCAYCGAPSVEIEHVVPISAGGENIWDNLTGACVDCNSKKSAKPLLHFLLEV